MDLQKLITSWLWDWGLAEIAKKLWQDTPQAKDTLNTTLGFIFKGLSNNASTAKWANDIAKASEDHKKDILSNITKTLSKWDIDLGDWAKILWHIFGNKTKAVESTIASNSWVPKDKISELLKTIAPIVLDSISTKKKSDGSFDIGQLSDTLTWSVASANQESSLTTDIINAVLGWEIKGISDLKNVAIKSSWGILKKILSKIFG